jgi:hypothetical protein
MIIFNYIKKKSNYSCVKFLLSVLWFIKRFVNARNTQTGVVEYAGLVLFSYSRPETTGSPRRTA